MAEVFETQLHKTFLVQDPKVLDDSFISCALADRGEKNFKAGLSIYDGKNAIAFNFQIITLTKEMSAKTLNPVLELLDTLRDELTSFRARIVEEHDRCLNT